MATKPKALRYADALENGLGFNRHDVAAELRRLYALVEQQAEPVAYTTRDSNGEVLVIWRPGFPEKVGRTYPLCVVPQKATS